MIFKILIDLTIYMQRKIYTKLMISSLKLSNISKIILKL